MKFLFILLFATVYLSSYAEEKQVENPTSKIDSLNATIIIQNNYPDTLKTFLTNQERPSTLNASDWITLSVLIATIIGLILSFWGVRKQLIHMSEQINLMHTESEVNSYRYYYDKWLDIENEITRDVLIKRFPELKTNNNKLDEIIHFIKFLDTRLTYVQSTRRFQKYYWGDNTVYKILLLDDYQEYWEKYVRALYDTGTTFMESIDNTIELVKLSKISDPEMRQKSINDFIKKMDIEWEIKKKELDAKRYNELAMKKINFRKDEEELQKLLKNSKKK